jgi:hypothetical protein
MFEATAIYSPRPYLTNFLVALTFDFFFVFLILSKYPNFQQNSKNNKAFFLVDNNIFGERPASRPPTDDKTG